MRSKASSSRAIFKRIRNNRGTALVAAFALVFLIFMLVTVAMGRVAASYTRITMNHGQASALFLAEAGIQKAAKRLMTDRAYTGETGTKIATGTFDVSVSPAGEGYVIKSTGYADTPFKQKPKKTVQAVVKLTSSNGFRVTEWKEDP